MPKFVSRQRKHKVLARQKQEGGVSEDASGDTNAVEVLPAAQREREGKKLAIQEELARESKGKMSSKKKKRLEKYIVRFGTFCKSILPAFLDLWLTRFFTCARIQNSRKRKISPF